MNGFKVDKEVTGILNTYFSEIKETLQNQYC